VIEGKSMTFGLLWKLVVVTLGKKLIAFTKRQAWMSLGPLALGDRATGDMALGD
jgi:hypothetical protein